MLRSGFASTLGTIAICMTLFGMSSSEARQINGRALNANDGSVYNSVVTVEKADEIGRSKFQSEVAFPNRSSRRIQNSSAVKEEKSSIITGDTSDKSVSSSPVQSDTVIPSRSSQLPNATSSTLKKKVVTRISYSFQRDGLPTPEQRRKIRNTQIELRPHRPFHFYGNAVRRRGRN